MALEKYKEKRNFKNSPEPTGGKSTSKKLMFVIQKHHASHLHYDFRLELRGVLKSWAVPKGPSMNPSEGRLAMLVEDHPWDYKDFEGIIPSGYGAGTVIVWDQGTYETPEIKEKDKKLQEHSITSQFYKGTLKIILHGHKIKGAFTLIRAKEKGENSWYLRKLKDEYASKDEIGKNDKSVLSGKTLEQVAENPERKWESHKAAKVSKSIIRKELKPTDIEITAGLKSEKPASPLPMMCTLVKEPFDDNNWVYELKLDGYRILADHQKKETKLLSRSGLNYTKKYTVLVNALKEISIPVVLDGEVVVVDKEGKPNFDDLQKFNGSGNLVYYVFDILWADGRDLMGLSLLERKDVLKQLLPDNETIKYTDHFDNGTQLFEKIKERGMEGIVAKKKESIYEAGKRSKNWLKIPTEIRQEFVIGGWVESDTPKLFRSLIFGAYNKEGKLMNIGHAGLGFKDKEMTSIMGKLKQLETKRNVFSNKVEAEKPIHYVKPELVGNFKFATWTASGKIRKPAIFLGFREDKDPKEVVLEIPLSEREEKQLVEKKSPDKKVIAKISAAKKQKSEPAEYDNNWNLIKKQPITSKEVFNIEGKELLLTNIEKIIWNDITKASVITYYHNIANYILPYLKDRIQSLHIKPGSPTAPGFYIKDMEGNQPEWATVFQIKRKHKKAGKRTVIDYLVCNNEATLLYIINLGCLDVNPGTSTIDHYNEPDFIILDLDPSDNDFKKVIKTALAAKKIFTKYKLKAFPKTSGKTGIHLYIPCEGIGFAEARSLAIKLATEIADMEPDISTTENTVDKRGNKVFIDYNQNDEADTVAAPYSLRPAKGPTVSTPLLWTEINEKLAIKNFDIHNIADRIKKKGDVFEKVLDHSIRKSNTKILLKLLNES